MPLQHSALADKRTFFSKNFTVRSSPSIFLVRPPQVPTVALPTLVASCYIRSSRRALFPPSPSFQLKRGEREKKREILQYRASWNKRVHGPPLLLTLQTCPALAAAQLLPPPPPSNRIGEERGGGGGSGAHNLAVSLFHPPPPPPPWPTVLFPPAGLGWWWQQGQNSPLLPGLCRIITCVWECKGRRRKKQRRRFHSLSLP